MSRPSVIFVTRRPPWPLDNGARIRSLRLAQGLAERFDLVLVTFADGPSYDSTTATAADLERALPRSQVELIPYGRPMPRGARLNVLGRASDTFGHYATPTLRSALERLVAINPKRAREYYQRMAQYAAELYRDEDAIAVALTDLGAQPPGVAPGTAVGVDPKDGKHLIVYTAQGVGVTHDGGKKWTNGTGVAGASFVSAITIDPLHGRTAYLAQGTAIYKTTDDGASWAVIRSADR